MAERTPDYHVFEYEDGEGKARFFVGDYDETSGQFYARIQPEMRDLVTGAREVFSTDRRQVARYAYNYPTREDARERAASEYGFNVARDLGLMTTHDAARELGIEASYLRRLVKQHDIGWNAGRDHVFTSADIDHLRTILDAMPKRRPRSGTPS